jgi:hypothetical protein
VALHLGGFLQELYKSTSHIPSQPFVTPKTGGGRGNGDTNKQSHHERDGIIFRCVPPVHVSLLRRWRIALLSGKCIIPKRPNERRQKVFVLVRDGPYKRRRGSLRRRWRRWRRTRDAPLAVLPAAGRTDHSFNPVCEPQLNAVSSPTTEAASKRLYQLSRLESRADKIKNVRPCRAATWWWAVSQPSGHRPGAPRGTSAACVLTLCVTATRVSACALAA